MLGEERSNMQRSHLSMMELRLGLQSRGIGGEGTELGWRLQYDTIDTDFRVLSGDLCEVYKF